MDSASIIVLVCAAVLSGVNQLRAAGRRLKFPVVTAVIAGVTALTSVAAEIVPGMLELLGRDRPLLLDGQWWRMLTPLVVQDGGWPGLVFNLVCLVALGAVVESRWGWRTLVIVYLATGVLGEVMAYTLIQHQGFAGNSVANLGLAGLIAMSGVLQSDLRARLSGAAALLAGLYLVVTVNLHAVGVVAGVLAAVLSRLLLRHPPKKEG